MADGYCVKSNNKREDPRLAKSKETRSVPKKIIVNKDFFRSSWLDSTMYNNQNYTGQGYQNSYPAYQQSYNTGYGGYEGYGQTQYMNTNVQPVPPGEEYPQNTWAPVTTAYNQHPSNSIPQATNKYAGKEDEGVAQERKQQHAQLVKQREEYVRKATVLRRELELLRNQKQEILSENSSQRDMEPILKENDKLQDEIQSKMKAIYNVIEMLSSIIKDGLKISDLESQLDESPKPTHKNHHHHHKATNDVDSNTKYNYMHYDPELHWCRICDEFPKTAKDLLLHLQNEKHRKNMNDNDVGDNTPWHKLQSEPELPVYENAPKKRIPIRGLQFFIAAPAWYCKLCDTWIGDLHCASHHLKSQAHFQNYAHFVEQNPHWEIEWLKDREKAMSRKERHHHHHHHSSDSESDKKKKKHKSKKSSSDTINNKDKKKKKRSKKRNNRKHNSSDTTSSSSSSSESSTDDDDDDGNNDKSKSIRVVMRNMKVQSIMNEDLTGKWEMLERIVDEHKKKEEQHKQQQQKKETDEKLINQWMTVSEPQDKEKVLLDNLKDRMKQKQEIEKAKYAELDKKKKEKEREELDRMEKKQREEQEFRDRYEREKRERERLEYERIRDKERESVRFKTTRENRESYRRKDSGNSENSPDRQRSPIRDKESPKSERSNENGRSRSRSIDKDDSKKKVKRLPFIGRMPLFKNKKTEERVEVKEIKKEDYDIPRRTRFQPGNLPKAFLPSPDVVCYPKLSSIPPLSAPPPPPQVIRQPDPPAPPKISSNDDGKLPKAPPAPKIGSTNEEDEKHDNQMNAYPTDENNGYSMEMMDPNMMSYYQNMDYMMYNQMYDYSQCQQDDGQMPPPPPPPPPPEDNGVPLAHTMPLQPPPLPPNDPNDDLAMLGISVDDMAAQSF